MNVRKTNIVYTANKWGLKTENNTTRKTDSENIIIKIMVSEFNTADFVIQNKNAAQ